ATLSGDPNHNQASITVTASSSLHVIKATYLGNEDFKKCSDTILDPTLISTTTAVTSGTNPSTYGNSVTFTATVTPGSGFGIPTGTVRFYNGSTYLGSGSLSGGQTTFSTASLLAGSPTITAYYGGDTIYASSTSGAFTQTVNKKTPTLVLGSLTGWSSVYGQ